MDTLSGRNLTSRYKYPSPFLDLGNTYMPKTTAELYQWCRYYFLNNPVLHSIIYKKASYPITEVFFSSNDEEMQTLYKDLSTNVIDARSIMLQAGLDKYVYGNAYMTIQFPFIKYMRCSSCNNVEPLHKLRGKYSISNYDFKLKCPKCGTLAKAQVWDYPLKSLKNIKVLRLHPANIRVESVQGYNYYIYTIPKQTLADMRIGKPRIVERIPQSYYTAARKRKGLLLDETSVYHMRVPGPSMNEKEVGLGLPPMYAVLKDAYLMQILKKAQEVIANENILPMKVLYPTAASGTSDPYSGYSLPEWKKYVKEEFSKWRKDPNYVAVMPVPMGQEVIGGQGKAMLLHQELDAMAKSLAAGMQIPAELIFGGVSWSGSNVSMRMVENDFMSHRVDLLRMLDFVFKKISVTMDIPFVRSRLSKFKMADDLQRNAFYLQLNQSGKISNRYLGEQVGFDLIEENKRIALEFIDKVEKERRLNLAQAHSQVAANKVTAIAQGNLNAMQQQQPYASMPPSDRDQASTDGAQPSVNGPHSPYSSSQQPLSPPGKEEKAAGGAEDSSGSGYNAKYTQQAPQEGIPAGSIDDSKATITGPDGKQYNKFYLAKQYVNKMLKMSPAKANRLLQSLPDELSQIIMAILNSRKGSHADPLDATQSPLPERRPPRREAGKAIV